MQYTKKEKKSLPRRILKIFLVLLLVLLLSALTVGLICGIYVASITEREIDTSVFDLLGKNSASKIYYYESAADREAGIATELEGQELYGGYRSIPVSYEELPKDLINAFVSIEDKRFFEHKGVDWYRTLGASLNYIFSFDDEFGGSTITQQLIKNVTERDEYSFERKIQEIFWALDLETKMSKEEILQNYLNVINLSNGCYGVGAAAEYYFSKQVGELTLYECATIAAITNNPSYYDPQRRPEANKERAMLILSQMYSQGYISEEEYQNARTSELELRIVERKDGRVNLWYVDMVIEDVITALIEERGYTRYLANTMLYRGGLKIYTAMDHGVQRILERYYADENNFGVGDGKEDLQSSMIIIDPYSGDLLGVAGAIGKKSANRIQNFATDTHRPAGSVIKPLSVYAPALEDGIINWASVYDDVPVSFSGEDGEIGWPKNANGVYRGLTNVNYAIEHSVNTVSVRVLEELGLQRSFDFLKNTLSMDELIEDRTEADGTRVSDRDYAALALGQFNYGVSVRDISAAYSIFVNKGIYSESRSFYKVTDEMGNIILERGYEGRIAISQENAAIMTEMLKNVVRKGTATSITLDSEIECAGKTGTTQKNYDRWYIGYTPYVIGGVWYGCEYPKALDASSSGICQKIWDEVMREVHSGYIQSGQIKSFDTGGDICKAEFCRDSGGLVCEACKNDPRGDRSEIGYFVRGSEPVQKCDCHILVPYDAAEGGVAAQGCYSADIEYISMIRVERCFPSQVYISDAQYVWRELPDDILPETSPELPFFNNLLEEGEYCGISYGGTQFNRYCRAHFDYWKWRKGQ